jgi:peptide/nickel transport system substrate-binding protein
MNRIYFLLFGLLVLSSCETEPKQEETINWKRTTNEVILRLDESPDRLNPVLATTAYATEVQQQIFSYLLTVNPVTLEFIPQLAKAWPEEEEVTDGPFAGGMSYTFDIFEEAVWDDGSPVTGEDFIFTVKTIFVPQLSTQRIRPYLAMIKDVVLDKDNPKRFTVYTGQTDNVVEYLTNTMYMLPAHIYDASGALKDIPLVDFMDDQKIEDLSASNEKIGEFAKEFSSPKFSHDITAISGSGPYKIESWETGQDVVLVKKENWWGASLAGQFKSLSAKPDRLIYKPIVDNVTAIAALKSEELDAMSNIDPADFTTLREDSLLNSIYNFETPAFLGYYMLFLNGRRDKLADKNVRKALAHAIDVDQIIETVYGGLANRNSVPVHPSAPYHKSDLIPPVYDIELARKMLKDAGWEDTNNDGVVDKEIDGERVEMKLEFQYVGKSERQQNLALLIKDSAKKAGFAIEPKSMDYGVMLQNTKTGDYDLSPGGRSWPPVSWNPKQNWHTEGAGRTGFGDADSDALIDKIIATTNKEEKHKLYGQLQEIIYDEQPEIYLVVPVSRVIVHKRFNWEPSPMLPGYFPNYFELKE